MKLRYIFTTVIVLALFAIGTVPAFAQDLPEYYEATFKIPPEFMALFAIVFIVGTLGLVIIRGIQAWQDGKSPEMVLQDGIVESVELIEKSQVDEYIEELYLKHGIHPQLESVLNKIIDVSDPTVLTNASDARVALHNFLKNTTDGDLST